MPFQSTADEEVKFVPVAVSVIAALPAFAEAGLIEVSVGAGLVTEKWIPLEVPPPGEGFVTVMVASVPACRSEALISAEIASEFK